MGEIYRVQQKADNAEDHFTVVITSSAQTSYSCPQYQRVT